MSVAKDASSSVQYVSHAQSATFSHTVSGANRLIAVGFYAGSSSVASSITFNGVALAGKISITWSAITCGLWALVAPDTGAHNVVVTLNSSAYYWATQSTSYTGVHQTTPIGDTDSHNAHGTPLTLTLDTTSGDVVMDAVLHATNSAPTPGSGQTINGGCLVGTGSAYYWINSFLLATGASTAMTWTGVSFFSFVAMVIKQVTVSGGVLLGSGVDGGMESGMKSIGMQGGIRG